MPADLTGLFRSQTVEHHQIHPGMYAHPVSAMHPWWLFQTEYLMLRWLYPVLPVSEQAQSLPVPVSSAVHGDQGPACALPPVHLSFPRSEEHTSELQSQDHLVCRLLLEKKKKSNHVQIINKQLKILRIFSSQL